MMVFHHNHIYRLVFDFSEHIDYMFLVKIFCELYLNVYVTYHVFQIVDYIDCIFHKKIPLLISIGILNLSIVYDYEVLKIPKRRNRKLM